MNCNYKVNIKDIQNKYKFNIFAMGGYNDSDLRKMIESVFYALPRTTASGTSVTLNDTARSYMHNELNATDTSQKTTTGINQFTTGTGTSNRINVNVTYNESETTINGTSNSAGNIYYDSSLPNNAYRKSKRLKAGDYTIKFEKVSGDKTFPSGVGLAYYLRDSELTQIIGASSVENNIYTFTLNEDTDIYSQIYVNGANAVFTNYVLRIQIVSGTYTSSNFPDYEPYTNGASPNPDYPQDIHTINGDNEVVVCGKNLCNITSALPYFYSAGLPTDASTKITINSFDKTNLSFSSTTADYQYVLTNVIQLKPNTQYTIKFSRVTGVNSQRFYIYNYNNGTYTMNYQNNTNDSSIQTTFTTNSLGQIVLAFGNGNVIGTTTILNIMLVGGEYTSETIPPYELYQSNCVLLTLGDKEICKIGNYEDKIFKAIKGNEIYDSLSVEEKNTLDYGKWYLRKNIFKHTFTGNENWVEIGTRYSLDLTGYSSGVIPILCNSFVNALSWAAHTTTDNTIILYKDSAWQTARLSINYSGAGSISNFKNYLSNNNVEAYYPLATPTNELFNDAQQEQLEDIYNNMLSYEGQTNISQINNDLPFNINSSALKDLSDL